MKSTLDDAPAPHLCPNALEDGRDLSRDVPVSQAFRRSKTTTKCQNRKSDLGAELRAAREAAGRTRAAVGVNARVAVSTVWKAERATGTLAKFEALASTMGMAVSGTALPPGVDVAARLLALRTQRGLGRRVVANLAGVSPTTLDALERGVDTHLSTVVAVAAALGATLRLVPAGAPQPYWTGTSASSAHGWWTTPPDVLNRLYGVVGGPFGLDPCSPVRRGRNAPVDAKVRYVAGDDGLALPWKAASVFVNPPYGRELPLWVAHARNEARSGRAEVVFALVPARCDTRWWHDHISGSANVWLLRGRLAFGGGKVSAPFPSAIVAWSATDVHRSRTGAAFAAQHIPPNHRAQDRGGGA